MISKKPIHIMNTAYLCEFMEFFGLIMIIAALLLIIFVLFPLVIIEYHHQIELKVEVHLNETEEE